MSKFRFLNASSVTAYLPDPHGGRLALAPGQWTSDPYYERFARFPHEKPSPSKSLIKVLIEDGVSGDEKASLSFARLPVSLRSPVTGKGRLSSVYVPADGSCLTSCETVCMTVQEFCASSPESPPEAVPPKAESSEAVASCESGPDVDKGEPAPTGEVESSPSVEASVEASVDSHLGAGGEPVVQAPESGELEEKKIVRATTEELLEKYNYKREDVSKDDENYVFIAKEGHLRYLSKLDPNFVCSKRSDMLRHIEGILGKSE